MGDVIFLPRRANMRDAVQPASGRCRKITTSPMTSLALLLRGAPAALQPAAVAEALLGTGSSSGAVPVWAALKAEFSALVSSRGIRGLDALRLIEGWRALVRVEGISAKARRRAAEGVVFRLFEQLADGAPGGGDAT